METMAKQKQAVIRAAVCLALMAVALPLMAAQKRTALKRQALERSVTPAEMRRRVLEARPLAMYYFIGDARGLKSFTSNASRMTVIAPQCYWVESDGVIRGEVPPRLLAIARRKGLPVMPLIFNRGFNRETVSALLRNPEAQRRAISDMADRAEKENLVGYQFDLENIDPADQSQFTSFVKAAAQRLHDEGRLLSVALVPKFTDEFPRTDLPDHPTMGEWAAAYDYRAIGESADFVTLMTYDHFNRSTPAGPIAGYEWVKKALDYAEARIPPDKLLLGIALYGREWSELGVSTFSRSLDAREVRALRVRWKSSQQWDDRWRSPWFQYHRGRATRTVWFENSKSWAAKLSLVREDHLRGFAAWRLGFEGPNFWSLTGIRPAKLEKRAPRRAAPAVAAKGPVARQESLKEVQAATSK
jgi:spore germination protein YaaH